MADKERNQQSQNSNDKPNGAQASPIDAVQTKPFPSKWAFFSENGNSESKDSDE